MVRQVSEIISEACGHLGQIAPSDFISTTDQDQLIMKNKFRYYYRELVNARKEDFRKEVDITTTAGISIYNFPSTLSALDITDILNVRYISNAVFNSWGLRYYPESEIERMFPNPNDMPQGKVTGWWLNTGSTAGVKELRFYLVPDATYTIRFYLSEVPTNLDWNSMTGCNRYGDEYLTARMIEVLTGHWFGKDSIDYAKAEEETTKKWSKYSCKTWNNNLYNTYIPPDLSLTHGSRITDVNPRY